MRDRFFYKRNHSASSHKHRSNIANLVSARAVFKMISIMQKLKLTCTDSPCRDSVHLSNNINIDMILLPGYALAHCVCVNFTFQVQYCPYMPISPQKYLDICVARTTR